MTRSEKCSKCGHEFQEGESQELINGKKYCQSCAQIQKRSILCLQELNNILYEFSNNNEDYFPRFRREIKQILNENKKWTLSGILETLKYIKGEGVFYDFNPDFGIKSIIENYYPIAKRNYLDIYRVYQENKTKNIDEVINKPPVVIVLNRDTITKNIAINIENNKKMLYGDKIDISQIQDED